MMYDTGHGPTFPDTEQTFTKDGGRRGGSSWSLDRWWFHLAPRRGRSTATARSFPAAEVGPHHHHQDRVTFGGGEGGFSPDLIGLISPAAKVTSSLMLE